MNENNIKNESLTVARTICPLCSYQFNSDKEDCHSSCPINSGCPMIKCPNCGYEFIVESRTINFFKKLLSRGKDD